MRLLSSMRLRVNIANKIEVGKSQKTVNSENNFLKTVDITTVICQLKHSKYFNLLLLRKPILHVISETKSKDYTLTLKTGRF